jgi:hypothetical protein
MTEMMGSPLNMGTAENIALPVPAPDGIPVRRVLESDTTFADGAYASTFNDADYPFAEKSDRLVAAFRKTGEVSARVRNQAVKLKTQQPLQLLAIIGGIALTAGVVVRIWRSL